MSKKIGFEDLEKGCQFEADGDFHNAVIFYKKASRKGNPHAYLNLGNMYSEGRGVVFSRKKAIYCYKMAIKLGDIYGASNIAHQYRLNGKMRWAKYWFEIAKNLGDEDAGFELMKLDKSRKI